MKIHIMIVQSFMTLLLTRHQSHLGLCHPSPWKLESRGTRRVGNTAVGGQVEEEEEKGQKQRRRARVTDLIRQGLTGESGLVCSHVRHTHTHTLQWWSTSFSLAYSPNTPGQEIIVSLLQPQGSFIISQLSLAASLHPVCVRVAVTDVLEVCWEWQRGAL